VRPGEGRAHTLEDDDTRSNARVHENKIHNRTKERLLLIEREWGRGEIVQERGVWVKAYRDVGPRLSGDRISVFEL
jgi:hypothetical protein